ncbi:MAG: uridylate kinase [Methanoregula sp.]|jgi:hypothetical protein
MTMTPDNNRQQHVPSSPLVVKVGGSLSLNIREIIPALLASPRTLLIVPGGGKFADAIRRLAVHDDPAHWMAIAAMEQYGWMLASYGVPTTDILANPEMTSVFLPYSTMRQSDPLPHSWNVTSDTIAAWVAKTLDTDLLILKSVDGIMVRGIFQDHLTGPVESDSVDSCFIPFVLKSNVSTMILNGTHRERVERFLAGEQVLGTRIGTTF